MKNSQVRANVIVLNYLFRRNDVISSVRDAAGLALEQIGGPQAEKAMQITKILAEEIRMLAQSS